MLPAEKMLSRLFGRITANEETSKHASSSKSLDFVKLENILQDPHAKPMSLPLDFLKGITSDFSVEQELGRGGYGVVYKGVLGNGKTIAVKKLCDMHLEDAQFHNEVTYLIRLKHQNIVQLVGYCAESRWEATQVNGNYVMAEIRNRMLCFEYLNNKSLEKHLSAESFGLEWRVRFDIIRGICCGLLYLHNERIVHLDLKPENILLDDNMAPKIADFGMSRLFGEQQTRMVTQSRGGTLGYMAPEYLANGLITTKSDIFSAGVIIIELMTGSKSYPQNSEELFESFIENVVENWRKRLEKEKQNALFEINGPQVDTCIRIGLKCIDPDLNKRPTAEDLVKMLSVVLPPFTNTAVTQGSEPGQWPQFASSLSHKAGLGKARGGATKVTTILGTSSIIDTLGSSFTSLNASSGFFARSAEKRRKISILAFEVANSIVRGCNVMRSVLKPSIKHLKEVVLLSEGVQNLISKDMYELLKIAAADKREELEVFTKEVARFGNHCNHPQWHNLDRYFNKLASERITQHLPKKDVQSVMQQLIIYVQCTSELYHELLALDIIENDYHSKKIKQDGSISKVAGDSLHLLKQEVKRQIKHVKIVQKKSLWNKNLEEMMEKLIDIVHFLHLEMHSAFGCADTEEPQEHAKHHNRLGPAGLSLHYANIINLIDTIVSQPDAVASNTRDTLYRVLPPTIKSTLHSKLRSFKFKEELTATQIKAEMEKTLRWLVPFANNTLKAHHGFGWVGEWANTRSEMDYKLSGQIDFTRIETLYHAEKKTTETHILELVILLHHLVSKSRNANGGVRTSISSTTQKGTTVALLPGERSISSPVFSQEQDMLRNVEYREFIPGMSKNQEFDTKSKKSNQSRFSKSNGHSPANGNRTDLISARRFSMFPVIDFENDRTKALDIIDGIEC